MPNLTGFYNFNELCLEAGASPPWIKKVQKLLSLGGGEGKKGARSYYTRQQVYVYTAVKMLRMLDIEFDDIKHIYDLENRLRKLTTNECLKSDIQSQKKAIIMHLIISLPPEYVLYFNHVLIDEKKASEIFELYQEYRKMQEYVERKAEEIQGISQRISENVKNFEKVNKQSIGEKILPYIAK